MRLANIRQDPKRAFLRGPPGAFSVLIFLMVLSCGGDDDLTETYTVRDSLGIRIVENLLPAWTENDVWRVDGEVVLDVSGERDADLFRPSNPWLLRDGRLALFDGGGCQVRFYDESGEFLAASGKCGGGPGEYLTGGGSMWPWTGDSLLVFDYDQRRVTIIDGFGNLGRTALVPGGNEMPRPLVLGPLKDGTLVLSAWQNRGPRGPGVFEEQVSLGTLDDLDDEPDLHGIYPGRVRIYTEYPGRLAVTRVAFGSSTTFAHGEDRIFVGFSDRYEIQVLSSEGAVDQIIRRSFQPVEVTQGDIDWLLERRLGRVEGAEAQRRVRQAYRDLKHAEVMPAFGTPLFTAGVEEGGPDMLVDVEGNLLVFDYYRPGEYRNHFSIFSPDGVWQGTVILPDRFRPSQIGGDFLVGTWTDDMGFVHIRQHRLIKP